MSGITYNTRVPARIVLDTNALVAAIRSRRGASFRLVEAVGRGQFELVVSVPLVVEYEAAALEHRPSNLSPADVGIVLDYLCSEARLQQIHFLWRPLLRDPKDDMVLEVAVAGRCDAIVTYNIRDFGGAEQFGIRVVKPLEFLRDIGIWR
jgi:putative PIN family toxin of toxin-antitoxin system